MRLRWFGGSKHTEVPDVERSAFHLAFTPTLGRTDRARDLVESRQLLARGGRPRTSDVPQPDAAPGAEEAAPASSATSD